MAGHAEHPLHQTSQRSGTGFSMNWKVRLGPREILGIFEQEELRQKLATGEIPWFSEAMPLSGRRYTPLELLPEFADLIEQAKVGYEAQKAARQQARMAEQRAYEQSKEDKKRHEDRVAALQMLLVMLFGVCAFCGVSSWWNNTTREYNLKQQQERNEQQAREQKRAEEQRAYEQQKRETKAMEERARTQQRSLMLAQLPEDRAKAATALLTARGDEALCGFCQSAFYTDSFSEAEAKLPAVVQVRALRKMREAQELAKAQQESNKNRGLLCADGTSSPSCTCGGPRRGCCSHHGGVKGCEPAEKIESVSCDSCGREPKF